MIQAADTPSAKTLADLAAVTLTIWHDPDCECPSDMYGWRLVSFSSKFSSYQDPDDFFGTQTYWQRTAAGERLRHRHYPLIGTRRKLDTGNAFLLDYFEHGSCVWSRSGTGPQCPWDNAEGAGILLWEGGRSTWWRKQDMEARRQSADAFLEEYTNWANGWCYGFTVDDPEGEIKDPSCGGFLDFAHLMQAAAESVAGRRVKVQGESQIGIVGPQDIQEKYLKILRDAGCSLVGEEDD
jgi:hypothetical protein